MGPHQRGYLHPAHQHRGLDAGGALAHLHPAHRGGGGLPDPQERPLDPAHLAPEGRARAGPHPGLLPRLRAVEDARAMAGARRSRQQPAHDLGRDRPHPEHRRRAAPGRRAPPRAPHPLRRPARSNPGHAARSARAYASRATPRPPADRRNVVPTFERTSAKSHESDPTTGEVGLGDARLAKSSEARASILETGEARTMWPQWACRMARLPDAALSGCTVYSTYSLKTLTGTQAATSERCGIPVVIAPVGSITQGSSGFSNHSVTMWCWPSEGRITIARYTSSGRKPASRRKR